MDEKQSIEAAKDNLNRILSFFSRVDTLCSLILALNLTLLAVLASNSPPFRSFELNYFLTSLVFLIFIIISFFHLYKCVFPRLEGGYSSLIYFSAIACRKEPDFIEEFKNQTEKNYLDDLLAQIWRNSEILKDKFHHLKLSFIFMLLSLIFWLPTLLVFISKNTQALLAK